MPVIHGPDLEISPGDVDATYLPEQLAKSRYYRGVAWLQRHLWAQVREEEE